ncbi:MAP kinase SakA [Talaromyces proteolyticus]|uniref:Mitogen-activated protein kinase n=1 Tax=Talaromyces proteolyticus TaxID=1131652 RepID=A0AAD4PYK2_9EURO|nr:MAP kinase SakA [Talaromyces proteolyticus]KAH8695248.1 MAP kinase SakA [Talaromyces proteolyticus]
MCYRYTDLKPIGFGTFGLVCSANDKVERSKVAIKKIAQPFRSKETSKRSYREMKLLNSMQHGNVINLRNVFISPSEDLYLVTELLDADLQQVLRQGKVQDEYALYFFYQIARGLKYIHSAGVIHRDLKPNNILINSQCDVKLCDFGLARINSTRSMTGYISTRYYRAPDVMLAWCHYNTSADIWSAGCILAEMLLGRVLFEGKSHIHQFSVITELLGTPDEEILEEAGEKTKRFVRQLQPRSRVPFSKALDIEDSLATDLLERVLVYSSEKRLSASQILQHPYLEKYHDSTDEPDAAKEFLIPPFDTSLPIDKWRKIM